MLPTGPLKSEPSVLVRADPSRLSLHRPPGAMENILALNRDVGGALIEVDSDCNSQEDEAMGGRRSFAAAEYPRVTAGC